MCRRGPRVRTLPQRSSRCAEVLEQVDFEPCNPSLITHCHTSADRFLWSSDVWARMPVHMRDRLIRQVSALVMSDYFSGMGCLKICLAVIVWEINQHVSTPLDFVRIFAECDVDPMRRRALLHGFSKPFQADHVSSNIEGRLPKPARRDIECMTPPHAETWLAAKQLAYEKIRQRIQTAFADQPHHCQHAFCEVHGEDCPVHPDPDAGKLYGASGGIICKDVSAYGSLEGDGGKSMVAQHTWVEERRRGLETFCLAECTFRWCPESAARAVSNQYRARDIVLDPKLNGDCVSRKRRVLTLLRPEAFVCDLNGSWGYFAISRNTGHIQ